MAPLQEPILTLCVCGIGLGAWVAVSGIFAELPVLVLTQPEGWKLVG
jgi:riboflavin transporter 2